MFTILNIFLSSVLAHACVDDVYSTDKHTMQSMSLDGGKLCTLRVSPRDFSKTHRKFLMNNQGMVMVFIDKPKGSASNTGSHTYHIVPVSGEPKIVKGDNAFFKDAAGTEWKHNGSEWKPTSCDVVVGTMPSLENQGAYDIKQCDSHFVIDSGFLRGENPIKNKERSSKIIGENGESCTVKNSKIFEYKNGEAKLKLQTSSDIKSFLRLIPACAHLLESYKPQEGVEQRTKVPEPTR